MRLPRWTAPRLQPIQCLALGYCLFALAGTALLMLPASSASGTVQPAVDAFFTATSAITTTGLVVVDTGSYYSLFGQWVILVMCQIGGLGYMMFFGLVVFVFKGKPTLGGRMAIEASLAGITLRNAKEFVIKLLIVTAVVELAATAFLSALWMDEFPVHQAVYLALFHSVSAFCTAGFSLFPDSLSAWRTDAAVHLVVWTTTIIGSVGFFVLFDAWDVFAANRPVRRLSAHSRLALMMMTGLIAFGTGFILITRAPSPDPLGLKLLDAFAQAVSASTTTGFNTVEIGQMSSGAIFMLFLLMFIGGSPGSTAGGIKTTTIGTVLATAGSMLRNHADVNVFGRRVTRETVEKAVTLTVIALCVIGLDVLLLSLTDPDKRFLGILFESASALGTTGLSTGITPQLSAPGKLIVSATMLIGRIGPLAAGMSLLGARKDPGYRYPRADIFVG